VESVQPNFGIRIMMHRLGRGLSQFELAELVGLSEGQISNIERRKSWTNELSFALIAKTLQVAQQSLFDYRQIDAFTQSRGLNRRAGRKPAKLIVTAREKSSSEFRRESGRAETQLRPQEVVGPAKHILNRSSMISKGESRTARTKAAVVTEPWS
jgi:transcriptional regulator with XRE-family HTH domain